MPQIAPSIRRKPLNAIGLARIVPMLGLVIHWIYRDYELGRIRPPSKSAILQDVIQLESLNPRTHYGVLIAPMNYGHVTERLPGGKGRIESISPDHERRINRYRRALRISRKAHFDRVQANVAALNQEECEECNRENRQQWKSNAHSVYSIAREV